MRLSALLGSDAKVRGDAATEVTGLSCDSRTLAPGDLFAALAGSATDGRAFIGDAIARGAAAVLTDPSAATGDLGVPIVVDADPRRRLALMAARFFGRQPAHIAAVTGTNGKTSVVTYLRQLWAMQGLRAGAIGTLGVQADGLSIPGSLTTPDPVALHRLLADVAGRGVEHLAIEASSHGLDQRRLDGLVIEAAAFTNLSRDHFDYHVSFEAYRSAKERLFLEVLPEGRCAVLNADAPEFEALSELCRGRRIEVIDYGRAAGRLRIEGQTPGQDGQRIEIVADGHHHEVAVSLVGDFQAHNLLAAIGLAVACGSDLARCLADAGKVKAAPGRMQKAAVHPTGGVAFVDYAHTPDALEHALNALRPHTKGRLTVVFGCGGDRDPGKRTPMGRIACALADRVIVTDDNPRSEDPDAIRAEALRGCGHAAEVGNRAEAIRMGFEGLTAGDVLLIAGKGHETGQDVGGRITPFDDVEVVRAIAREIGGEPT